MMKVKHPHLPFQVEILYQAPQTIEPALYSLNPFSKNVDIKLDDDTILKCDQAIFIRRDDIPDQPKPEFFMALAKEGELVDLKDKCDISDVWQDKITPESKGLFGASHDRAVAISQVGHDNPLCYLTIAVAMVTPTVEGTFKPFFFWMRRHEDNYPLSVLGQFRWLVKMDMLNISYNEHRELIKNYACYLGITSEEKLISYMMTTLTNAYRNTKKFTLQWFTDDDPPF